MKNLILPLAVIITMALSSCNNNNTTTETTPTDSSSAMLDAIFTRTSIRSYEPDHAVSRDTVEILLRAAMSAPSAVNKQP